MKKEISDNKYEECVKQTITQWLKNNNVKVWWEKKNRFGYPIFNIKGSRNKPDLLIKNQKDCFISAIEVKRGEDEAGIRKGRKILEYYKEYTEGTVKYFIDDLEIKPKYFLVATENSIHGHIFNKERIRGFKEGSTRKEVIEKYGRVDHGTLPCIEYDLTFRYLRDLWEEWKRRELKNKIATIGVLTSLYYNEPMVQYQRWDKNAERWRQFFSLI